MMKACPLAIVLSLALSLAAGLVLSALQPSWWTRQIEFTRADAHSSPTVVITGLDTWFTFYALIIALFLLSYFVAVGADRLSRHRRLRNSQARNVREQQRDNI
jgi:hypothetical protein